MDTWIFEKLQELGPAGAALALMALAFWRPPRWVHKWVEAKAEAERTQGLILSKLADRVGELATVIALLPGQIEKLNRDLNDRNRHAEMNAIESVNARALNLVGETREYLCERIDESLAKAVKRELP